MEDDIVRLALAVRFLRTVDAEDGAALDHASDVTADAWVRLWKAARRGEHGPGPLELARSYGGAVLADHGGKHVKAYQEWCASQCRRVR